MPFIYFCRFVMLNIVECHLINLFTEVLGGSHYAADEDKFLKRQRFSYVFFYPTIDREILLGPHIQCFL